MAAIYANKFTVEIGDVARIVFIDERQAVAPGLPMASATVVEIILTRDNCAALGKLIAKLTAR
jgi:hypothetical protein